jgi:hypothetical protein
MEKVAKEKLRQIYTDILRGQSSYISDVHGEVFVKHLTIWDTDTLDEKREMYFNRATKSGLPTTKEKIDMLMEEGSWAKEKEKEQREKETFVSRMKETKLKLLLKSEKANLQEDIDKAQEELDKIISEKTQLIGLTSELFADKKVNDYYIYLTLYRDKGCKKLLYDATEFDEVSNEDLSKLVGIYNYVSSSFSEKNMKRIALSSFFLNNYYLCKDNPFIFFGKPVVELTYHQADLFAFGRYYKHMLQDMKNPPPPDVMQDPDKLLEMYEVEKNQEKMTGDKEQTGTASTVVGATKDDLEALGMTKDPNDPNVVDLNEEIRKKGGELSMEDLIKLHGA